MNENRSTDRPAVSNSTASNNTSNNEATADTTRTANISSALESLDFNDKATTSSNNNARRTPTFQQIRINIKCARLTPHGGLFNNKADLYAEIITDGSPSRKTEIARKTWSPQWNENFDILVTPTSRIEFRVFNHQTFKSDSLVGYCLIFINKLSQDTQNFHFRNLEKTFDLVLDHKGKTGVVEVVFNGIDSNNLRIGFKDLNMIRTENISAQAPSASNSDTSSPTPTASPSRQSSVSSNLSQSTAAGQLPSNSTAVNASNLIASSSAASTNQNSTSPTQASQSSSSNDASNAATASSANSIQIQQAQLAQGLPQGWEVRFDKYNRPYYLDHNTQATTWQRPVPMPVENDLPPNWERRLDSKNRPYYIDHNTRTTTWFKPTINSMANYQSWQNQRQENQNEQYMNLKNRHLFNNSQAESNANSSSTGENSNKNESVATDALPEGWEMRLDINNRAYYVNHKNHTTQWEDPRTQGSEVAMLQDGWEIRYTDKGERIFIDHINKRTTFEDPRGKLTYERDFKWKISKFRYLCQTNTFQGHVKVQVSRANLFDDSYNQITKLHPYDLRRKLFLTFKGEEGLDYGGVAREWFFLLSHEVLNPNYCLFQYTSNLCLQINQGSFINPDHIDYFRFIGRFVAMALYHGKFIDSGFSLPFYKQMLNKKLTLQDLESIDPTMYNSLVWIQDNVINDDDDLGIYFCHNFELLGKTQECELKPGGIDIKVTEENKEEYLNLLLNWKFTVGVEEQTKAFLEGFNQVVPLEWLKYFDERELELMLCGIQEYNIKEWEESTIYRHYTKSSKPVVWFWQFVNEITSERRARLLQFVTGTSRLPLGGFKELVGSTGPQKFCIEKVGKETWLPRSHTCFNRLDLPPYKSYEQLKDRLLYAIEETEGFAQE